MNVSGVDFIGPLLAEGCRVYCYDSFYLGFSFVPWIVTVGNLSAILDFSGVWEVHFIVINS